MRSKIFLLIASSMLGVSCKALAWSKENVFGWDNDNPKIVLPAKLYVNISKANGELVRSILSEAMNVVIVNGRPQKFEPNYEAAAFAGSDGVQRKFFLRQITSIEDDKNMSAIHFQDGTKIETKNWLGLPNLACKPNVEPAQSSCIHVMPSGKVIDFRKGMEKVGSADSLVGYSVAPDEIITRLSGKEAERKFSEDTMKIAAILKVKKDQEEKINQIYVKWRMTLEEGSQTQCGRVVERKKKMVLVQGDGQARWHLIEELFPHNIGRPCV